MQKRILYIDMDGVVADFWKAIQNLYPEIDSIEPYQTRHDKVEELCVENPRIFKDLEVIENSVESVKLLAGLYDVYFLSTPMWGVPESWMDKRLWIEEKFGKQFEKKLILSHRKDLLIGDYLIDDRTKNGVDKFTGEHIHFGIKPFETWIDVELYLLNKYLAYQ